MKCAFSFLLGITLLSAAAVRGRAQADFRPGYILTAAGDSISGWVSYPMRRGADECRFRRTAGGELEIYTAEQVAGFGFRNDKALVARSFPDGDSDGKSFLELLVRGRVSLYVYHGRFFLERAELGLRELKIVAASRFENNGIKYARSTAYLGLIRRYLYECPALEPEIESIDLTERQLVRLFEHYYQCSGGPFQVLKANKPWLRVDLMAGGGALASTTRFTGVASGIRHPLDTWEYAGDLQPVGGLQLDFTSPRILDRLSVHSGLWYVPLFLTAASERSAPEFRQTMRLEVAYLQIPVGLRYFLRPAGTRFFFNAGMTNNILVHQDTEIASQYLGPNNTVILSYDTFQDLNFLYLGLWGGGGLRLDLSDHLGLQGELRLERSASVVFDFNNQNNSRSLRGQLLLSLLFW